MADPSSQSSSGHRPPIVVVLGHVDHGKTSLLDAIRQTNVAAREAGGITQHIGAYQAKHAGKTITFLDTPGHEAFTAIRSRGAKVADIAILVVAADESVKPQTEEAIRIIQETKLPFVVALNKIDKSGANPQKVKQDLAGHNVLVEDWGGTVPVVEVSAREKRGIDDLLDIVLLLADLEDLKDDRSVRGQGVIIESHLDKRRGYIATALIRKGTLSLGDWIVAGTVTGKIKSMEDFAGQVIEMAVPAQPVVITGWANAPEIGRQFQATPNKDAALEIVAENVDLAPLFSFFKGEVVEQISAKKHLKLIVKTDVSSSLEAIDMALRQISSAEVAYTIVASDIGAISDADIRTAVASGATIIGFRVPVEKSAEKIAEHDGVRLATFEIIYELIEYVRSQLGLLLAPEVRRTPVGKIKILAIFKKDAKSQVVGGRVTDGVAKRGALAEVMRNGSPLMIVKIGQVQQNKEDVPEVAAGNETGIRADMIDSKNSHDIAVGDVLELYTEENFSRTL